MWDLLSCSLRWTLRINVSSLSVDSSSSHILVLSHSAGNHQFFLSLSPSSPHSQGNKERCAQLSSFSLPPLLNLSISGISRAKRSKRSPSSPLLPPPPPPSTLRRLLAFPTSSCWILRTLLLFIPFPNHPLPLTILMMRLSYPLPSLSLHSPL